MKKKLVALIASIAAILCCNGIAIAERATFVVQDDAPLKVLAYTTDFGEKSDIPRVIHEVRYQNRAKTEIVGVRFGILEYNGYDEKMDGFLGYVNEESDPGEKDSATFINEAPHATFFEDFGAGYLWIDAVRFVDGKIWKGDRTIILEELKKLNHEVTAVDLSEKKSLPAD